MAPELIIGKAGGINHLGLQTDTLSELQAIRGRLDKAQTESVDQDDAHCCYAESTKTWTRDPDGVAWETFVTHGEHTNYGDDRVPGMAFDGEGCCRTAEGETCCI